MANAALYREVLQLPTYAILDENINPPIGARSPYPYPLQDHRAYEVTNEAYDAVILENDFLRVTVIPSLGGRIYSAVNKLNGREIFTKNPIILPRMIGRRGAWISGGVEFNFPISHSPNTMDIVTHTTHKGEDGSVAIVFGNIEQMYGMNWKVELKLYPGKAYIEQNVRLYNPTAQENRYYFWTNAAVEYTEDIKLIYPFDWSINNYTSEYIKWPFYKGFDCSNAREIPQSYETFGKLMTDNFFSVYNMKKDHGIVHFADRKKLKGAKFFIWGNDPRGDSWNRALTNDGSKYIEIQSGPFESQGVFKFLKPHQTVSWSEYWYPVDGLEGLKYAEKELALNAASTETGIAFKLLAVEELGPCRIVLSLNGQEYEQEVELAPGKPETVAFDCGRPYRTTDAFSLEVYGRSGHILSMGRRDEYNAQPLDVDLYEDSRVVPDPEDEAKLLNQAVKHESFGQVAEAADLYRRNLEANPACSTSRLRLGLACFKRDMIDEARTCFEQVLRYDNQHAYARFYLAAAVKLQGDLATARRLFMDIAADADCYMPSVIELAKINIALRYYKDTETLLESHIAGGDNRYARFLLALCYRKDGLADKAARLLSQIPVKDEYLAAEQYFLSEPDASPDAFLKAIAGDRRVLKSLAVEYIELGQYVEAAALLRLIREPDVKKRLLERHILDATGGRDSDEAAQLFDAPLDYAFVNEKPIASVLRAVRADDPTGKADYLLGNYYLWLERDDDALACFMAAYDKGLRYTVLLRNIGRILWKRRNDPLAALPYLEVDVFKYNSGNSETIVMLDEIYQAQGDLDKRAGLLPHMRSVKNRSLIIVALVNLLTDLGHIDEALSIMRTEQFENWEGREISGPLYRKVIIRKALQEKEAGDLQQAVETIRGIHDYPENINYGEAVRATLAEAHYYKGVIFAAAGLDEEAAAEFRRGAQEAYRTEVEDKETSHKFANLCAIEAQKRL